MTDDGSTRTMLVVRPWLGAVSGGEAFGHLAEAAEIGAAAVDAVLFKGEMMLR